MGRAVVHPKTAKVWSLRWRGTLRGANLLEKVVERVSASGVSLRESWSCT